MKNLIIVRYSRESVGLVMFLVLSIIARILYKVLPCTDVFS